MRTFRTDLKPGTLIRHPYNGEIVMIIEAVENTEARYHCFFVSDQDYWYCTIDSDYDVYE